ncbi:hypothetical protein HDA30_001908 [Micrococcus cohnii]|uniref:Uncharacterized protein n=1 Tax=Micrococcus cohnii TaxID=993416 RepID=A0A7W7GQF5_9MICC|nr:hypothetical protein [Micrococcus cohnii]MBB4736400.1 hypothetical protein [Micrococcus cohnii]
MSESNDSRNFLEEQVTAAADALGTRRIERLAEVGCTTNADPEAQAKVTQWEAYTSLDVESDEQADEMARDLASALLGNNWHGELTSQGVTGEPFRTLLQATSHEGGYRLRVSHTDEYGENYVAITMTSPCQKNPEGHQMARSPLDPGYAGSDADAGKYDVEAERKARADGTATPVATPTARTDSADTQPSRPSDSSR